MIYPAEEKNTAGRQNSWFFIYFFLELIVTCETPCETCFKEIYFISLLSLIYLHCFFPSTEALIKNGSCMALHKFFIYNDIVSLLKLTV